MADEAAWAYARAIVDLAVRRETLDEVEDGVRALAAALRTDPELHRYLLSPIAGRRARAAAARLDAVLPPDLVDALGVIMAHSRQASVSYTHLTLPTIYSVLISVVAVSLQIKNKHKTLNINSLILLYSNTTYLLVIHNLNAV